jgi:Na+/H+-dicarboxylate symporter
MWSRLKQLSLSFYIFLGLILGLAVGLFFGELVQPLNLIGKAYTNLLKMAAFPYIVVSLIYGLGSLSTTHARLIALRGSKLLLFLWAVGLAVIFVFPLAFPSVETSAFFSEADLLQPKEKDFLEIYIPSNVFESLAKGTIPATVFFCVFLGFALNRIDKKRVFLNVFSILSQALSRVTELIIKTSPVGVFALTAMAAGTFTFEQLQRLEVYFVSYVLISLSLAFVILPSIIICFTPFTYRQVMHCSKDALFLGFATGSSFIILPLIASRSLELINQSRQEDEQANAIVDSVLPVVYCFPSVGNILEIFFIVFVAWFANQSLNLMQYLDLAVVGVMSIFGSSKMGVPFLLEYMKLPSSYFELYILSEVFTRKFKVLVHAMSYLAVTLIMVFLVLHNYKFNLKKVSTAVLINFLFVTFCIITAKVGLHHAVQNVYQEDKVLLGMEIQDRVPAKIFRSPPDPWPGPQPNGNETEEILTRIKKRGVLKVGYNAEALPFAFFNQKGELVGYDIFLAHRLARDLGVTLEFIPVDMKTINLYLERDICDIVMSGVPITTDELGVVNFTEPYMNMNAAFVLPDYRKNAFRDREDIAKIPRLKIAVTPANTQTEKLRITTYFPKAQLIELAAIKDFFTQPDAADALLTTDKIGKAWALLDPKFGVAVPQPLMFRYGVAYPIAITKGDHVFLAYLNQWLRLQQTSGTAQEQFSYWILGKTPLRQTQRWSIIHDVLHWVK